MARPLRIQFPNALYHVTSRGVARCAIFADDEDRRAFLELLARELDRSRWLCHAYCLMPNHFHLMVETLAPTLSKGMQRLNSAYSQGHNRRHGRTGHLLQGRFHAVLIEKERHLLEVARYVVLNPCRAGLCRGPADWPWSSYRATAGLDPARIPASLEFLLAQFGTSPETAHRRYREFVAEGVSENPWRGARGIYLGSQAFVRRHAPRRPPHSEASREEREPFRPQLADVLGEHGARGPLVAREHGYSPRVIGAALGLHRTTVIRRIRMLEKSENATG